MADPTLAGDFSRTARPTPPVYLLGGFQTDFARNVSREGLDIADLLREAVLGALAATDIAPREVEAGHVGNFVAELYVGQSHLAGLFVEAHPELAGAAVSRHEAACASGGVALLAAMADIASGRYDLVCVAGVELMRKMGAFEAQQRLAAAAWVPRETAGVAYPWPALFSLVADEYQARYGLSRAHLGALAQNAYDNARRNPNAQTRRWTLPEGAFSDDDTANPVIAGQTRRQDASQVTDGAAAVLLASPRFAEAWALRRGIPLGRVARIEGFGHRTARMGMQDKLEASRGAPYVFPHVRGAILDAFARAGIPGPEALSAIECHDCFTISHYAAIDHFGITPPGQSFRAIEDGTVLWGGRLPMNPSGGLIGAGHPVGATGVRMALDAQKQVTGTAGDYQVPGARRVATLNIGGSTTTTVVLVIGRDEA